LGNTTLQEQISVLNNTVCYKGDTAAKVLESSPPNVTFTRDLVGPRRACWNALLQCLALVQLMKRTDKFRWNLHENGKFSVDSMYRALILPTVLVDKKIEN
jgi:hypothetical protein